MHESAVDSAAWVIISAVNERGAMEDDFDHHHGGVLTELDLVVDACLEKVTCKYEYGADVSVLLTYAQEAPGALQSGYCVWPAAPALCAYLEKHRDVIPDAGNIVELGAGCGLAGLAVAQLKLDATVIFTDHDPGVLKTIEHNAKQQERKQATCHTQSLRWGVDGAKEVETIEALQQTGPQSTDLIVGSDVIYAKEVVPHLFWTVDRLLKRHAGCKFLLCSSFAHSDATEAEMDAQSERYAFHRQTLHCSLDQKGVRIQQFTRK